MLKVRNKKFLGVVIQFFQKKITFTKSPDNGELVIELLTLPDPSKVPETIIGVTAKLNNQLSYLVKFKDHSDYAYVAADNAVDLCPDLIIQFFKNIVVWFDVLPS